MASELAVDDFHHLISLVHHLGGKDAVMWGRDHVLKVTVGVVMQTGIVGVWVSCSHSSPEVLLLSRGFEVYVGSCALQQRIRYDGEGPHVGHLVAMRLVEARAIIREARCPTFVASKDVGKRITGLVDRLAALSE